MSSLQSNPQLELAFEYVQNTNKNVFLTGKAGTGKTTFLRQLRQSSHKRMAVVAPTGVAAINAGGMTIHSLFQLPFGPYLPESNALDPARQRRFTNEKIRLIKSLDLLVIDEISMVRADVLDGIDEVLRRYLDRFKPFGGLQLLMIGDLHQLPPVVKDEEWELLREHYSTAYFFGSQALQKTEVVNIQLTHIFRQSDETFINLLNKVRDNRLDQEVMDTLNSRYIANFQPPPNEHYITLTAHNLSAQKINQEKLALVKSELLKFKARIDGDFPSFAYPADEVLEIKIGAQVMFMRNDLRAEKRYFNGKIGKLVKYDNDALWVKCPDDDELIEVKTAEWENIKYSLNEENKEVQEEVLGTFTQFPLKLAWAITIHKSQGLTFDRAIIDANAAFAHGQVYVALSRCRSFEGIVLRTRIENRSVKTDRVVRNFSEDAEKKAPNVANLDEAKAHFQQSMLDELFDFKFVKRGLEQGQRLQLEFGTTLKITGLEAFETQFLQSEPGIYQTADGFRRQLAGYYAQEASPEKNTALQARLQKAGAWFIERLTALHDLAQAIQFNTDNKDTHKRTFDWLQNLRKEVFRKKACFNNLQNGFKAQDYLRSNANAELDYLQSIKDAPKVKKSSLEFSAHPDLMEKLKEWRIKTADEHKVEPVQILHQSILIGICEKLPTKLSELKKIKGLGGTKLKMFSIDLLEMVQDYCANKGLETQTSLMFEAAISDKPGSDQAAPDKAAKTPKPDTKLFSFELFKGGKSIDEIAHERGITPGTVTGHLAHYVEMGQLDITKLLAESTVKILSEHWLENPLQTLTEVRNHFEEAYTYEEIRLVKKHVDSLEREVGS
jgi:PIF1-like helicase/Helix-turn-helix domain/HRDC domain